MISALLASLLVAAPRWDYRLHVPEPGVLEVQASFPAGSSSELVLDPDGARFVSQVALREGDHYTWRGLEAHGDTFTIPACARGCQVSYRFQWARAAAALSDVDQAAALGQVLEAAPALFLLRPRISPPSMRFRLVAEVPAGVHFQCGLPHPTDAPTAFEGRAKALGMAPYAVLGPFEEAALPVDGGELVIARLPGTLEIDASALERWVKRAVRGVQNYFGRFPKARTLLVVVPTDAGLSGKTLAGDGATILLNVGAQLPASATDHDWVLTHELVHLAWPRLSRATLWLDEGLATYVEPLARFSVGLETEPQLWRELVEGLPQGLPARGEGGLDGTSRWGRLYWGGARYFLLADLALRQQTQGRHGLRDALRGIVAANLDHALDGDLEGTLRAGDHAAGAHVLEPLHARLGERDPPTDLEALFVGLGVRVQPGAVHLDDRAPQAPLRRAITDELRPVP